MNDVFFNFSMGLIAGLLVFFWNYVDRVIILFRNKQKK